MRRYLFLSFLCLVVVQFAGAGDITGKVTLKGVRGKQVTILYLEKVDSLFKPPAQSIVMDQKNLKFEPHVMPVVVGTRVDFLNSDDVLHNVFSPDACAAKFNLGTWPKGEKRSFTFDKEGCFSVVLCNVHPEMEGWIIVLQNPFFAAADDQGTYRIENIPAGKYTLVAWHERLKNKSRIVEIPETGETSVDFTLSRR
ncbi:MAG: carboxypeptidase regulatory-like domain-containing protein [Candidatus Neomarinimicrobiota bacterium]